MSLLKALMLCLVMAMTITTTAHSEITLAPQGGITDILQIGRNAIVVTIDRSSLPVEIRHEVAIVTLTDTQGNSYTHECKGSAITLTTDHLTPGMCTVRIHIGEGEDLDESHSFMR